jgi:hypothetical protein
MGEQLLYEVHQDADQRVHIRRIKKNADNARILACTPNTAPDGKKTEYGGCAHLMLSQ